MTLIAYGEGCRIHVGFMISEEDLASGSGTRLDHSKLLCGRSFITVEKDRESFWHRHQNRKGEDPVTSFSKGAVYFFNWLLIIRVSFVAQTVKHVPAMQETGVQSLGQGDPLEKEMATHSSNLAWKIPWIEEPGRLQSMGSQRVRQDSKFASLIINGKNVSRL